MTKETEESIQIVFLRNCIHIRLWAHWTIFHSPAAARSTPTIPDDACPLGVFCSRDIELVPVSYGAADQDSDHELFARSASIFGSIGGLFGNDSFPR